MVAEELEKIYKDTEAYIMSLEESFLKKHLNDPLAGPDDYDYDVKSFCILCHAAFEDFAETIALKVMNEVVENYVMHHRISESIVSLMHFKSNGINYFARLDDNSPLISLYDYTRKILEEIKTQFSKEIIVQNHGVSLKYIRQLLMPVAIDIPNDAKLLNSLKILSNERGFYAHRFLEKGVLKKSIEPEKAKTIVDDCLLLCWDIRDKAKSRIA